MLDLASIVRYLIIDASTYKYLCERIGVRVSVLAKRCSTRISHDLWDIFILGKPRYSPHRTGSVYAPHQRGSSIIWVLDIDTLDTYSIKSWY